MQKGEKKLFGTANESTELREKYDSILIKVFYIHGCTGRLYRTDAMPKEFTKKRHRLEAKSTQSEMAQQRESREKIRMVGLSKERSRSMVSKS